MNMARCCASGPPKAHTCSNTVILHAYTLKIKLKLHLIRCCCSEPNSCYARRCFELCSLSTCTQSSQRENLMHHHRACRPLPVAAAQTLCTEATTSPTGPVVRYLRRQHACSNRTIRNSATTVFYRIGLTANCTHPPRRECSRESSRASVFVASLLLRSFVVVAGSFAEVSHCVCSAFG